MSELDNFSDEVYPATIGGRPYYTSYELAEENPAFLPHNQRGTGDAQHVNYVNTSLISDIPQHFEGQEMHSRSNGRRIQTARASSRGIEDIIMEMPSRTLGRKSGQQVAAAASGSTPSFGSYSRYMQHQVLTHQDAEATEDATDLAHQLYDKIAGKHHGDVPNSEIRSLPVNMKLKRTIRRQANNERDSKKSKQIGGFQMWRYNMAIKRERLREGIRKRVHSPRLWSYHLKQVEGNFGSGVSSYFIFLRGLFFLSFPSFFLNFAFITLPQVLDPPQRLYPNVTFTGEELITGANWLNETIMYYGYYTNSSIVEIPGVEYKMPLAYLLATAGYFILCLVWLSKVTATSFRENYIEGQVSFSNFIGKTFCAWDYGITSRSVAALHQKIITTDLKEVLAEKLRGEETRSALRTCELYMFRILTWALYFVLTGGSMALIFFLNRDLISVLQNSTEVRVIQQISLAIIVSLINLILPIFINLLTQWEKYKNPRVELYIAVSRNFLLKLGMLAVICAFWTDGNLRISNDNVDPNTTCWETELGQEVYRLIIFDFLFSIIFATFCAEFLRKIFARYFCTNLQRAEFSIVNNVMDLIYGQTLCWIGVFFSPLLALIVFIKYFIMFYVKKVSVMNNCQVAKKRWRAAQSNTMFNVLLLLSFLLSTIFFCIVIFRKVPSPICGPYRGLNRTYDAVVIEFEALYADVNTGWFAGVMGVLTSIWFLSAVNTVLVVFIVMRRSKTHGLAALGKALREQIVLEGRDKVLLLKWLQQLSNHNGPSDVGAFGGARNHHIPILKQHHASSTSIPARAPSEHGYVDPLQGDVLTHVDPQHVAASTLAGTSPMMRRKLHHDPVIHRALASKGRPTTVYDMREEAQDNFAPPQRSSYSGPMELEVIETLPPDTGSGRSTPSSDELPASRFQGNVYLQSNF